MTLKEIIEITNTSSVTSEVMEPIIKDFVTDNPEIGYTRINHDEEPELVKLLVSSQIPTISPFFVGMVDGKIAGGVSGVVSKEDLENLVN
jgi:hypothetical protein